MGGGPTAAQLGPPRAYTGPGSRGRQRGPGEREERRPRGLPLAAWSATLGAHPPPKWGPSPREDGVLDDLQSRGVSAAHGAPQPARGPGEVWGGAAARRRREGPGLVGVGWPGRGPARGLGALGLLTLVDVAAWLPAAGEGPAAVAAVAAAARPGCVLLGGPAPAALGGQARKAGGARSPLPLPALRGTALRARERRASRPRPTQAPQTLERGRLRGPPGDAAAPAPSLCIRGWCVAVSLSALIAIRSRVVGGEICLKTRDRSQFRSLGRVPVAPRFIAYRERSSLLSGDAPLLAKCQNLALSWWKYLLSD